MVLESRSHLDRQKKLGHGQKTWQSWVNGVLLTFTLGSSVFTAACDTPFQAGGTRSGESSSQGQLGEIPTAQALKPSEVVRFNDGSTIAIIHNQLFQSEIFAPTPQEIFHIEQPTRLQDIAILTTADNKTSIFAAPFGYSFQTLALANPNGSIETIGIVNKQNNQLVAAFNNGRIEITLTTIDAIKFALELAYNDRGLHHGDRDFYIHRGFDVIGGITYRPDPQPDTKSEITDGTIGDVEINNQLIQLPNGRVVALNNLTILPVNPPVIAVSADVLNTLVQQHGFDPDGKASPPPPPDL